MYVNKFTVLKLRMQQKVWKSTRFAHGTWFANNFPNKKIEKLSFSLLAYFFWKGYAHQTTLFDEFFQGVSWGNNELSSLIERKGNPMGWRYRESHKNQKERERLEYLFQSKGW